MIPLAVPNLTGNERKYLNQCIDTQFVSSVGEFVGRLEDQVAQATDSTFAVATSCGTTALHLGLMAVGVRPGDLVIMPSMTFIASANAISHCGAEPWLFDVSPDSWTIDPGQVRQELRRNCHVTKDGVFHKLTGRAVSAIMPVYTLGNVPEMDTLTDISKEFGIPIVADAACALGARYKSRDIGNMADVSAISLNGNKTVTAGGGGLLITNDEALARYAKHISTTARTSSEYDFDAVGYNYRMTNLQAAVGCAQLERLAEFVDRKREVRSYYRSHIGACSFPEPSWCESACWFSGIVLQRTRGLDDVRGLCNRLKNDGIEARSFWKPIHEQLPYKNALQSTSLAVTNSVWNRIVTLPCSTGITDEELEIVAKSVNERLV